MNLIFKDQQPLIEATNVLPAVSLIIPFHPVMTSKRDLEYQLKRAMEKIESQLMGQYPRDMAIPVIENIRRIINTLNYNTHKKSVAILVSPLIGNVYYLDVVVEERIVVDSSFRIRELIDAQKQTIQYLVLLLSAERSKMYLGNCSSFHLIKSNVPTGAHDRFLSHMDQGLSLIHKAYPFPVFVLGPEKVLDHFRQITHNEKDIVRYVNGNFPDVDDIQEMLRPYLDDWQLVRQTDLVHNIRAAENENKLSKGIREVWEASMGHHARLLVVEKGFIEDGVDAIIEKVLAGGGEVQFIDDEVLKDHGRIVLIKAG